MLWHEIEWHIPTRQYLVKLVYDLQVLKLVIVTLEAGIVNAQFTLFQRYVLKYLDDKQIPL